MIQKTFAKNSYKLVLKILFWIFLLTSVFLVTFILLGYFAASKPITYLSDMHAIVLESYPSGINQIELESSWYKLLVDENGKVAVKTFEGEIIMSSLEYYSVYEGTNNNWGLKDVSVRLSNDSTISITGNGPMDVFVNVFLTVHKNLPKIDLYIKTHYNLSTIVLREALVAKFDVPLSEVYLKNRKIDVAPFDSEYWLQRQGVRFGHGDRSALVYHTPGVSSLQLNSEKKILFVNLEYSLDHPYVHFPYQLDGGGRWTDLSAANYIAGTERNNNFSIYFGRLPQVIPRLMLVPNGFLAGYVFTEHADEGDLRRNRAVYLGAENISDINSSLGGFVGHKIPVTKSVFYIDTLGCSVRDDPQFLDFLDQLDATGLYDICLHTPEYYNSNRKILEESIKFMKERFDASTWIDHGFFSGKYNRESFICDGLNSSSEYYTADLWGKYNTRYFWNAANEYIGVLSLREEIREMRLKNASVELWRRYLSQRELKGFTFYDGFTELLKGYPSRFELNSLQPIKGNSYPTPLYWQNLTRTGYLYSWGTDYEKVYSRLSTNKAKDQLAFEQRMLNRLLTEWGVFINHGYFARNQAGYDPGTWTEREKKIIINPYFDKILEVMARMRDEGNLYITTIRDLMDYWILLDSISFEYMQDGAIIVYNDNDVPIKGLSLVVDANAVWLDKEIPKFKRVGEETIFWFDIPANDHVSMHFEQK